ncbi:PREDICTED: E3 ubiquitin-protein ligase Praja-2-like [Ipomoea nil]|uniref:E3 ubiquitin-protein ligase Praja-2-like n=1 Tax=Ipomoea nil TaxID=35883 RepID=UPI000900F704|nr:PREDICTED: E3 ubiquitin-protein ligase Praja-2-like [Ipomoea nil]
MEKGIDLFACSFAVGLGSVRPHNPDNYDSDSDSDSVLNNEEVAYLSDDGSVLDNEEVVYLSDDGSVLDNEEVTYLSNDDSILSHEEVASNDDSVIHNEEVINLLDNNSVLDNEEVTYLSDNDSVLADELANFSDDGGGSVLDYEEVTYLSYDAEAYPTEIILVSGENSGAEATRGVDQNREAIKSLERKIIEYDERDCGGGDGDCCVICLEELTAGTVVAVMPCNHCSFHDGCLSTWLERSLCCPLCRRKIPGSPPPEPFQEHDQYIS